LGRSFALHPSLQVPQLLNKSLTVQVILRLPRTIIFPTTNSNTTPTATMPISFYDITVATHLRALRTLSHVLSKAEAHAAAKSIPLTEVFEWRLIDDMLPLRFQVQTVCNAIKNCMAICAHLEMPAVADDEKTIDDLKKRIAATEELLRGIKPEDVNGKEDVAASSPPQYAKYGTFTGYQFAQGVSNANVAFHLVTAYDICRAKGVDLGKRDYLRAGMDVDEAKSQLTSQ